MAQRRTTARSEATRVARNPGSFTVVCGIPGVAKTLISSLERQGFHHDQQAATTILLDTPRGFALRTLEQGRSLYQHLIVTTWSFCPEYWEDLWDYRPSILIAGDGFGFDLIPALTSASQGTTYRITPGTTTTLSPFERRIIGLAARGCTNEQIAKRLAIQLQSVKNTLSTIYQKLNLNHRSEAILYYWGIWHVLAVEEHPTPDWSAA